ncbi:glycosyl hydrolase family 18 protein [Leptospira bouyouniensis]|uniref:glycosyl hydrolase family 18 protein n=1 Tax=Leptospira bouyouniensis TaxID=2484911 RepID=UPI001091456C|nr:glycosyl hydrolase family 18 protein [Leptospira bouyouniensis]TGM80797.1 hydrolase [Leptospira bouyouniensis]
MSESQSPNPQKHPLSNVAKYSLLFTSWFFLSAISFYLGMNLMQNSGSTLVLKDLPKTGNTNPSVVEASTPSLGTPSEMETSDQTESKPTTSVEEEVMETPNFLPDENVSFRSSAWSTDWTAMKKTVHLYNEIHPFIYTMKGGLSNNGELISSWSSTSRKERVQELRALNPKVKIIPTIFRWENPKEKIQENIGMGGRNDIRDHHIQVIVNEILTYGYDGIDIDYEGMSCDKKEKFEEFFAQLAKEVHKKGKLISVAVHPKTPAEKSKRKELHCRGLSKPIQLDFRENWRGPTTHDYEFLAKHADRVKIMAYELHPRKYHNPGPGPQAPNVWLKDIITYAKKRVPTHKLYMAIPTYGYDWALNCKASAKAIYHSDAQRIKAGAHKNRQPTDINRILNEENKVASWKNLSKFSDIHKNRAYEDPSLWYTSGGCDRVAFYMNRRAFEEKMNLLRKYDLGGFSFWQLVTDNDPEINVYLSKLVQGKIPPVEKAKEEEEPKEETTIQNLESKETLKVSDSKSKQKSNSKTKQF